MTRIQQLHKKTTIPSRNGVSPGKVFLPKGTWRTYEDFLAERFPVLTKNEWHQRIIEGDVLDSNGEPLLPDSIYHSGQTLYYYRYIANEPPIPFQESVSVTFTA